MEDSPFVRPFGRLYGAKVPMAEQIRALSDGTIATLTGKRRHDEIDAEREKFAQWTDDAVKRGELPLSLSWQMAWVMFCEATG